VVARADRLDRAAREVRVGEAEVDVEEKRKQVHRQQQEQGGGHERPSGRSRRCMLLGAAHAAGTRYGVWLRIFSCSTASAASASFEDFFPSSASPSCCAVDAISSL